MATAQMAAIVGLVRIVDVETLVIVEIGPLSIMAAMCIIQVLGLRTRYGAACVSIRTM